MSRIQTYLKENYPDDKDILLADGFEDAFIGVVESFGAAPKACYNYDTCIDILMERPDEAKSEAGGVFTPTPFAMTHEEAVEYLEFNVTQAYVGEYTPAFIKLDLGERKL